MDPQLITIVPIRAEPDIVLARRAALRTAALLGFPVQQQIRVAAAASEIARNAIQYAGGGTAEILLENCEWLLIRIVDAGPGIKNLDKILAGHYRSNTGMGVGIAGAQRLMDAFQISNGPVGTMVEMRKRLPLQKFGQRRTAAEIRVELTQETPSDVYDELQLQNQVLVETMAELEKRQAEVVQLNHELEETNRGVVALYAELEEKAEHLRHASEIKTRFLSNMTHEFRTPLNSILTLSKLLLDRVDGDLTPEQELQVGFIRRSASELSELVNDLLDLAKIEAGRVEVRPSAFQLSEVFATLRGTLKPMLGANASLRLIFEEVEAIPPLYTDQGKVTQVVRNFVSNALKFTERGEVRLSARLEGDRVIISVSDTGLGIAAEDQRRIFQEFVQVEGPHQGKSKGTGLGLPLARRLAELLGGQVTVESQPGIGSTFSLAVPVRYGDVQELAFQQQLEQAFDPSRVPVLFVDGDREAMYPYEKTLRSTGFQMFTAQSVPQAREGIRRLKPAAVVLASLTAPPPWELIAELKASPDTRVIPVIVISHPGDQGKAAELGADEFLAKPAEERAVLAILRRLADGHFEDQALIIDDDEVSRYLLKSLLASSRFRIVEATRGAEGLRLAHDLQPAVIFLDLAMPDMNGFQVLEELRRDPITQSIPIVVNSSYELRTEDREMLLRKGIAIARKNNGDWDASQRTIREALIQAGIGARC